MALLYSSSSTLSPVSEIILSPYSTQIVTTNVITPLVSYDYDTGLNTSSIVQKDTTRELLYLTLDKWLYSSDMCNVLKYLKIVNGKVQPISNENEYKDNKVCNDSVEDIEMKSDYIHKNILDMEQMRKLLMRITDELDYKWYDLLTSKKKVVMEVVEKYLKKKLRALIGNNA
jgi:hypothetical protein